MLALTDFRLDVHIGHTLAHAIIETGSELAIVCLRIRGVVLQVQLLG